MRLVVIFFNKPELLEELLEAFVEIGVPGATVVDSVGMGQFLSAEVPIFAGLREVFAGSTPTNKVIFTVVPERLVDPIYQVLDEVTGDFTQLGAGVAIVLPISSFKGPVINPEDDSD